MPTLPISPPTVESLSRLDAYREANRRMLSCTSPASMLDMCAVSLPAGLDPLGMPAGLQLIGHKGADRALLDMAAAVALPDEDVSVATFAQRPTEGDVLRVPLRDGAPVWEEALADPQLRAERLAAAQHRLDRLAKRDPGGDLAL